MVYLSIRKGSVDLEAFCVPETASPIQELRGQQMSGELPPLQGEFDDVCPMDAQVQPEKHAVVEENCETEYVAVLGYN